SQWTCERIGGAHFSRTASTHDREHANRSTDTANAPCKAVSVTENGAETLHAYFHGFGSTTPPGAIIGSCGTTSFLREERRERTVTRAAFLRAFRAFLWHSEQRRESPSLVRRSAL